MDKLISRNHRYYEHRVFVMCDCSQEIIEFYKSDDGEYTLMPHCWYNEKLDKNPAFTFNGDVDFKVFIDYLKKFINYNIEYEVIEHEAYIELDKYLTYKNKMPGVLIVTFDNDFLFIGKFANITAALKNKKCVWEIVLRKEEISELIKELETFMN